MSAAPPQPRRARFTWAAPPPEPAGRALGWAPPAPVRTGQVLAERYLFVLGLGLLGYAVLGRGFAYVGVPPLFVGEGLLVAGLAVAAATGALGRALALGPIPLLLVLLAWVAARTVPYLGTYGLDAVRDAMAAGYGLYAVVVASLLVARPERLAALVRRYGTLAVAFLAVAPWVYVLVRQSPGLVPTWPWAPEVHVVENKPGDLLVHLAGVTACLVLGLRRQTTLLLVLLLAGVGVAMVGNRGGMVGYALAMAVLAVLKPRRASFGRVGAVGAALVVVLLLVDTSGIRTNEGSRAFSVEQIWENVKSVVGQSDEAALRGTTAWRLRWWSKIAGYTLGGEHFWDGRGFGVNLATADGFQVNEEESLRSPHNVHLTFLARAGVPGLALWLAVHAAWVAGLLRAWSAARRAGRARWTSVFAMCAVYWTGALVNATFDVYLEGPMGAVWFWTVFGVGAAAVWIYRRHPEVLADPSTDAPPPAPRAAWHWPAAGGAAPLRP